MKAGWKFLKISEFAKTGSGGTPKKGNKDYYEDGSIPWLRSGEVCRRDIIECEKKITQIGLNNSSAKLFPKNSVLVAMYGATAAQSGILRFEAATNQAVCAVLPNESYVTEFLYYYMLLEKENLVSQAIGNAQPNISQAKIKNTIIPFPTLEEQKRIVAILDEAFAGLDRARAHTEANLQNARDLFEAMRKAILTKANDDWIETTLDNVCIVERGSSPRPIKKFRTDDPDGVNWIKIGDTKVGSKYVVSTKEKITKEGAEKSRRVGVGDFILTNSMTYGRPYIMAIDGYIHDGWFALRLAESIQSDFFYHLLSSAVVQEQFANLAAGAVVKNISGDLVKKTILNIPPFEKQKSIAKELDEQSSVIDKLEEGYATKLTDLDDLRQSLLQKAFAGELT